VTSHRGGLELVSSLWDEGGFQSCHTAIANSHGDSVEGATGKRAECLSLERDVRNLE